MIVAVSCQLQKPVDRNEIYSQVIPDVISNIFTQFEISHGGEIIVNPINDHLDSMVVAQAIDQLEETNSKDYYLLNQLSEDLNKEIEFDFAQLFLEDGTKLISSKYDIEKYDYDKNLLIGVSTISPVVLDQKDNEALFYIDLQCGKGCGGGYLVFLSKQNTKWVISQMLMGWN